MKELKQLLIEAPNDHLDAKMRDLISKWDDPDPKPIQVLEVLDHCVHGGMASEFTLMSLEIIYTRVLEQNNIKHEDVVPLATWRYV